MELFVKAVESWVADRGRTALDKPLYSVYCTIVMHSDSDFKVLYTSGGREVLLQYFNTVNVNGIEVVDSLKEGT